MKKLVIGFLLGFLSAMAIANRNHLNPNPFKVTR